MCQDPNHRKMQMRKQVLTCGLVGQLQIVTWQRRSPKQIVVRCRPFVRWAIWWNHPRFVQKCELEVNAKRSYKYKIV